MNTNGAVPMKAYQMFGMPCGLCYRPVDYMFVYRDVSYLIMRHAPNGVGTHEDCNSFPYREREVKCPQCGVLHSSAGKLCKSCRNQEELFKVEQREVPEQAEES